MKTHRLPGRAVVRKVFLVVILVVLALQGLGINGLAAPATWTQYSQDGGGLTVLSCSAPIHRNAQVVLMIDDSGSMIATNDRGFSRNEGAKRVVDVLSDKL